MFIFVYIFDVHVRCDPCHHGMARPQVADGGKASKYGGRMRIYWISIRGQPTKGGPPAWGFGVGLTTPHRKKEFVAKYFKAPGIGTDSLARPKQLKKDMRFGT